MFLNFNLIFPLLLSFIFGFLFIPKLISLCHDKGLYKKITSRDVHHQNIPNIGGVAVFLSVFLGLASFFLLDKNYFIDSGVLLFFFSAIIIFLLGLYDDIANIGFAFKFFIQFFLAYLIIFICDIKIDSFYGLFNLYDSFPILLKIFSTIVFVFIINSFNLVDGIDGLAVLLAIFYIIIFSIIFFLNSNYFDFILSLIILFSLFAFYIYNKPNAKIFLGDSGSLFVGFLIAYFSIKLCNMPILGSETVNPVFILCILSYPSIDALRVFTLRILNNKSPFVADKNHIHHYLISMGTKQLHISFIALTYSSILIVICFSIIDCINFSFYLMIFIAILLLILLFAFFKTRN